MGDKVTMNKYNDIEIETAKNLLEHDFMWIVRNKNGKLFAHFAKPSKVNDFWASVGFGTCVCNYVPIFQNVKFEDSEPVSLEAIVHPQVLDDEEKRYLKGVIRPFRYKVAFICKVSFLEYAFQHIVIGIANDEAIALPLFEGGTMYEGMKSGHGYTLEELGL